MKKIIRNKFDLFSEWVGTSLGHPMAFTLALLLILVWAGFGPLFHFSETWQLIVNTGTTIATFLMVFLLQNTQNRDTAVEQETMRETLKKLKTLSNQMETVIQLERKNAERLNHIELVVDKPV